MTKCFEFTTSLFHNFSEDAFLLEVPTGIQSKTELLNVFAKQGQFPEYYGKNWDALLDCLRDFSWIPERKIVILHRDVPLSSNSVDCQIYLQILREVIADWVQSTEYSDDMTLPSHELRILFPESEQRKIFQILS